MAPATCKWVISSSMAFTDSIFHCPPVHSATSCSISLVASSLRMELRSITVEVGEGGRRSKLDDGIGAIKICGRGRGMDGGEESIDLDLVSSLEWWLASCRLLGDAVKAWKGGSVQIGCWASKIYWVDLCSGLYHLSFPFIL